MILDQLKLTVESGKGGAGSVNFRREKFVPKGGPDGGDGGDGGDIIFQADNNLSTFLDIPNIFHYKAEDGNPGMSARKHGKNGKDILIKVPCGTVIKDDLKEIVLSDLVNSGDRYTACKGGKGGKGNIHFATSTKRAPNYAQPGLPGEKLELLLELRMIADVGLVGFPNAGKSTLLSVISNAQPKIADYPFTTLTPNLGIVKLHNFRSCVIADIPGIIEGAHEGKGLGYQFLKHIKRNKILLFLIDITDENPYEKYKTLIEEIREYDEDILEKKHLIVFSKIDLNPDKEVDLRQFHEENREDILFISSALNKNLDKLKNKLYELLFTEKEDNFWDK